MTQSNEEFNILTVKRHIKNLIAGNGISKTEIKDLYKQVLVEQIDKRIKKILGDVDELSTKSFNNLVEIMVKRHITDYMNKLVNKSQDFWNNNPRSDIERMISRECAKQVDEIIKQNLKITFGTIEVKGTKDE